MKFPVGSRGLLREGVDVKFGFIGMGEMLARLRDEPWKGSLPGLARATLSLSHEGDGG
jgi:hypothetical protein